MPPQTLPTWGRVREALNEVAKGRGEWGGLPVAVHGLRLQVEPRHPIQGLNGFGLDVEEEPADDDCVVRNSWFCLSRNCAVYVVEEDGKAVALVSRNFPVKRLMADMKSMGVACNAWSAEAEAMAMEKLAGLIGPHKFKLYLLTGMFPETSKRSGVTYLFRRLRPTVAVKEGLAGGMRVLCTLCLHPIGYYRETGCGVMVPTDDVIAHVMMMRADEHLYWRKANQHPAWAPESGL